MSNVNYDLQLYQKDFKNYICYRIASTHKSSTPSRPWSARIHQENKEQFVRK